MKIFTSDSEKSYKQHWYKQFEFSTSKKVLKIEMIGTSNQKFTTVKPAPSKVFNFKLFSYLIVTPMNSKLKIQIISIFVVNLLIGDH